MFAILICMFPQRFPVDCKVRPLVVIVPLLIAVGLGCNRSPGDRASAYLESGKALIGQGKYSSAFLQFKNAARLVPKSAEPLYYMGLISITQGNASDAIRYLSQATKVDPKYSAAQIKLAEIMVLSHRADLLKQAETRALAILSANPGNVDAIAVIASLHAQTGDFKTAEKELHEALNRNPTSLKSSAGLASLEMSQGNWAAAENILQRAATQSPGSADPLVALGELYAFNHRESEAATQFARALQIDPRNVKAMLHLAQIAAANAKVEEAEKIYAQLAHEGPGQYRELYAAFLAQSGKLDLARTEYWAVLQADPGNRRARTGLVAVCIKAHRVDEANLIVQNALARNSTDIDALRQKVGLLMNAGRFEESRLALMHILEYEPNSVEAHYFLSGVYKVESHLPQQYQELNEALRLDPKLLPARIDLAQVLVRESKANEALDLLNRAPSEQQQTPMLVAERNWTYLALGDLNRFRTGIPPGPVANSPEFLLQRGILCLSNKDIAGAQSNFEKALQEAPSDLRALDALARTYVRENRVDLALEKIRQYADRQPHSSATQLFAGDWLRRYGKVDAARQAFNSALSADSSNSDAELALAQLDLQTGDKSSARARLERVLKHSAENETAHVLLAQMEESMGDRSTAISHYRRAIELSPSDVSALNNLAYALSESPDDASQALAYAQKAKEIAPDDPAIDDTLAWVFFQKGLYHEALRYELTAANRTHNAIPQYHLAMIYFRLGDQIQGKDALAVASRLDPTVHEAELAKKVIADSTNLN